MPRLPLPRPLLENLPAAPQAYVVGGTVRDLLMQRHPTDIDIAVDGDAALFAGAVADRLRGRVIPMGKPGQTVYRVASREMLIDVSPLKNDRIEDDLAARDFTVNAMAWDLGALALVDPLSGREDLAAALDRRGGTHRRGGRRERHRDPLAPRRRGGEGRTGDHRPVG